MVGAEAEGVSRTPKGNVATKREERKVRGTSLSNGLPHLDMTSGDQETPELGVLEPNFLDFVECKGCGKHHRLERLDII